MTERPGPERQTIVLMLDLTDDPDLIAEYEARHRPGVVWPEVTRSLRAGGVDGMRIYRLETRLVLVIEASSTFSFDAFAAQQAADPLVVRWEEEMWRYQAPSPGAPVGGKWAEMRRIYDLDEHDPADRS